MELGQLLANATVEVGGHEVVPVGVGQICSVANLNIGDGGGTEDRLVQVAQDVGSVVEVDPTRHRCGSAKRGSGGGGDVGGARSVEAHFSEERCLRANRDPEVHLQAVERTRGQEVVEDDAPERMRDDDEGLATTVVVLVGSDLQEALADALLDVTVRGMASAQVY